jgi:pimeloyl-ACP methyl ester carboxylesterase
MDTTFTASHRGGSGPPMVCLHGFTDTWRTWELVLPALEARHDVLAPTLAGHAGGPPLDADFDNATLADAVERAMDDAGFERAHIVGNSLGGAVALQLAARGRADTVVALAPAGGWAHDDEAFKETVEYFSRLQQLVTAAAPFADQIVATVEGRRTATQEIVTNFEHIPAELIAHQLRGAANCPAAKELLQYGAEAAWELDAQNIACPVRMVWGTADKVLPWPSFAVRYREELLPDADWVLLEGIGHCPQLDVPSETAQLILGVTAP